MSDITRADITDSGATGSGTANTLRRAAAPLAFAVAYFLCALIALNLTSGIDGIAAIWPASGVFAAGLILFQSHRRTILLAGVAIGSLAANFIGGAGILIAAAYTTANLLEGGLIILILRLLIKRDMDFARPSVVGAFTVAAIAASVFSAMVAAALSGNWSEAFLTSWFSTVLLGMLSVTPTILFVAQDGRRGRKLVSIPAFWVFLLTAGAATLAFGQDSLPLLFLPMLAVLFTMLLLGLSGSAVSMLIVVGIGSILTAADRGIVSLFFQTVEEQVRFFQFYVFGMVVSVMPLAVIFARHKRDIEKLKTSARLLELSEQTTRTGHWRLSLQSGEVILSSQFQRLTGIGHDGVGALAQLVALHHPDDQAAIKRAFDVTLAGGLPSAYDARIQRGDGEIRMVEGRAEIEIDGAGEFVALFGTIRDVTDAIRPDPEDGSVFFGDQDDPGTATGRRMLKRGSMAD